MNNTRRLALYGLLMATSSLAACVDEDAVPPAANPGPTVGQASVAAPAPNPDPPALVAASSPMPRATPPGNEPATVPAGRAAAAPTAPTAAAPEKAAAAAISGQVTVDPAKLGQHIVVYLQNAPLHADKLPTVAVDQHQMTFLPFLTVVPVGGKVMFHNADPFPHNVFSPTGERFNLGTMGQSSVRVHVFDKPGAYTLLCNVHPGMLGYIYVVPSSYYVVADKDGKFSIKDVPNGTYTLAAWGPKLAESSQTVTVAGSDIAANLELHRGNK